MGSIGSGRRYLASEIKLIVEEQISINIHAFNKDDCLVQGKTFTDIYTKNSIDIAKVSVVVEENFLFLQYSCKNFSQEQVISFITMPVQYGGTRPFFICPFCNSRRVSLYLDQSSTKKFGCRICHGFGYKSQRLNPHLRHTYMAEKIKSKLKYSKDHFSYQRPVGMRHTTYNRLRYNISRHEIASVKLFKVLVDNITHKFERLIALSKKKSQSSRDIITQ